MAGTVRGRSVHLLEILINRTRCGVSRSVSNSSVYSTIGSNSLLSDHLRERTKVCGQCNSKRYLHGGGDILRQAQESSPQTAESSQTSSQSSSAHPATLAEPDLLHMFDDIRKEMRSQLDLHDIARYYFDGQGKAVRPLITVLMSRAINTHLHNHQRLYDSQRQIAKVTEMIHTASLVHDDVLDGSDTRRGKPSVNMIYGQRKAVMAGDYILSVAATILARIRNEEVIIIVSQVLADLVQGEFMQLGSKENENERFAHYLKKTFKKTASLLAYSCKAVAVLANADEDVQEVAFQYGRNVGIAFQLIDDLLDFVASSNMMGKPTAADLKLGLATAPVLFACEKFPELNPMIMRRFQEAGDVQRAFELVHQSDGLKQTRFLAKQHCQEAIKVISSLKESDEQKALIQITHKILSRPK